MALAAQVGAGTYKKLGDEAPFSTEFTSKSGVLFSRKLSFGRKPKGVQASAFGVDGVLEPKIGMLPEEATAFGETGVLQRERGHTPFVYRHQGRSSETNAEAIAEFLQAHADAELIEGGKVRCTTTGFELPCDLYWLKSHWEGRKYAKCAARRIAANINAYDKTRPVTRVGKVAHATSKASKPPPGWPPTYDESQHANLLAETQITYEVLGASTLPKKAVAAAPIKKKRLSFAEELEEVWTLEDVYQIDQARERLNEKKKAQSDKPPPATPPHPLDLFPTTAAATIEVSEEDDALLRLGGSPSRVPAHPPPAPSPVPPPPLEPPPIEAWKSPDPPPRAAKHSMLSQKAWMRKAEVAAASPITPITTPKAEVQAMVQAPEAAAAAPAPELSVNEVKAMVKAMRVAELREALTGRGLSAEGLKPALTERLLAAVEEAAATTTDNTNTTMTVDGGSLVKEVVADEDNKENGGAVAAAAANVMSLGACIMSSKTTTASKPVVLQTLASRRSNRLAARNA